MKSVQSYANPTARATFRRGESAKAARKEDALSLIGDNFSAFDRDGNGLVSWKEMRSNVADPRFQGKDAAALATFYSLVNEAAQDRGLVRNQPVSLDFVADLQDEREYALEEGEPVAADLFYAKYLDKLEGASTELFAGGLPNGAQVHQGYGPSCAFLAATVGQARANPEVIKEAISERPDGKVEVKFPGLAKPIVVAPSTDTETALFSTAGKNGSWLNTLEKAWGTTQTSVPEAAFEKSSWPTKSIRAWTHGKTETTTVPKELKSYKKGEIPDFMRGAVQALASNYLVVTWTRGGERKLENLVVKHAHTMTGFNAETGKVQVRNPWGHHEPLGKDGKARDGRDDGVFEVTLEEYVKDFASVARQVGAAKPPRASRG